MFLLEQNNKKKIYIYIFFTLKATEPALSALCDYSQRIS